MNASIARMQQAIEETTCATVPLWWSRVLSREYTALKVAMYLTTLCVDDEGWSHCTIAALGAAIGVRPDHVMQSLRTLKAVGIVERPTSRRLRGYRLVYREPQTDRLDQNMV